MNRMNWVRAEALAIGAVTSRQEFFQVVDGDSSRGGLKPPASSDRVQATSVESIRLDDYVSRAALKRLDIVKLDVEGAELDVLAGAPNVLEKFRPLFICEVLDAATHAWKYEAREIVLKFQSYGFNWFEFRPDGSIAPHQIRERYPDVRNYLAVPSERCPLS
ncbi:MAG TPA: FkbM family methyltransferase, partial [Candidatus Solibacter sp.]|nr:FkbM family methyltransferase [Candidatus Solibacter sp.]